MANTYQKIKQYFERNGVSYEGIEHKPAASAEEYHNELGTQYEQQAKALLIRYKKQGEKGYVIVAIQAQKKANLAHVKELLGAKSLRMADVSQLQEVIGCNFGELPPLGKIFGLKLLMDKDLLKQDKIYFNAGRLDYSMAVDPKDIQRLDNPIMF